MAAPTRANIIQAGASDAGKELAAETADLVFGSGTNLEKARAYYADLNQQVLGYEPPAIHLLHVNALNAATLDAQLNLFREAGYRFVSLAEAQADPAYAEPPETATRFGPMWSYRWARDRGITVDGRLEQEPPEWVSDYAEGKPAG